ncbi:MAG: ribose-5-phosphate isomerase RpiA [Deltaproteobacteria bacterium]|nr:ribose-5-phosphate isomerase RpiA [Deltaproteobacteria bacterium]
MTTTTTTTTSEKELVARHAAHRVKDGMIVGLGTGSTANLFIQELARRRREDNLKIVTASSSIISTIKAQEAGLPLISIEHLTRLDLYVDGADEVAPDLTLLKGRGADLVREKLLAQASDMFLVLVDQSKMVDRIGARFPIPVEVLPWAWQLVQRRLEALGGRGALRLNAARDGAAVTSSGNLVLEMIFDAAIGSHALDDLLNSTPGVIEHGIFCTLTTSVALAIDGQVQERFASKPPSKRT